MLSDTRPLSARDSEPGALPAWVTDFQVLGLPELYRRCAYHLPPRLGYERGSLYVHDPARRVLTLASTNHERPLDVDISMDAGATHLMVAAAQSGELLRLDNAAREKDRRLVPRNGRDGNYRDGACLVAPLFSKGVLRGVLNLSGRVGRRTGCNGVMLPALLRFLGRALENAQTHEQACTEARIDALTGLYNHRWMIEALESEIRRVQRFGAALSVLLIDVDRLKVVNDMHGHAAGDLLLRHMSGKISAQLRRFDAAARIGGDEFVVMLPSTDAVGAAHVGGRILDSIRRDTLRFRDTALPTTASLGVSAWRPGWQAQQLIEAADHAMYRAKQQGRNRVVVANPPDIDPAAGGSNVISLTAQARR
ncbi:MAG: sensor domain-containing diguanylate cyclase [Phycisphaerae bacterium]|nr:sensor domain-containing diguanylate cyclase [Phycisphaerae bacterium]